MICLVKITPWNVINLCCFTAFVVQISYLVSDQISPDQTVSITRDFQLDDIQFPVLFKICIKPSFNVDELQATGYQNIWKYFIGQSLYNDSLFGWAGHAEDGQTIGSAEGNLHISFDDLIILITVR